MAFHPHVESTAIYLGTDRPGRGFRSRDEDFLSDDDSLFHPELTPGKTVKCWFFFVMTLAILIFMSTSLTAVPTQILFGTFITVFLMMLACIPLAIFDCKRARLSNRRDNDGSEQTVSDPSNPLIRCELSISEPSAPSSRNSGHRGNWQPAILVSIPAGLAHATNGGELLSSEFLAAQTSPRIPMDDPPPYNLVDCNQSLPEVHGLAREPVETPPPPYDNIRSS